MFGIGMQEIVLICVIALIVVGPKRLPEIARALGKGYAEFRRAFDDMKRTVEADIHAEEIRRSFLDLPPPPPPQPPPPPPVPESLLTGRPADAPTPFTYPEQAEQPRQLELPQPQPRAATTDPHGRHDG